MSEPKFDPELIRANGSWMGVGSEKAVSVTYGPRSVPVTDELVRKLNSAESTPSGANIPDGVATDLVSHVHSWWKSLPDEEKAAIDASVKLV